MLIPLMLCNNPW